MNYTIRDGEIGKTYYTEYERNIYIFKIKSGNFNKCEVFGWITPLQQCFNNITLGFVSLWMPKMRLATPEEAGHLEQCIQAGKYVEYKKEELPAKWCIRITENNRLLVKEFFQKNMNWITESSGFTIDWYYHFPNFNSSYCVSKIVEEDYTEITFDQFKKLVPKENTNMEKKIIGYNGLGITKTQEEWENFLGRKVTNDAEFTPVYEEEYKVGDYVVLVKTGTQELYSYAGKCVKVLNKTSSTYVNYLNVDIPHNSEGGFNVNLENIRKATPEEIKAATIITIDRYTVEYPSRNEVKIGCNLFNKAEVRALLDLMSKENSSIDAIRAEGIIVTKEQIQEIYNKFE